MRALLPLLVVAALLAQALPDLPELLEDAVHLAVAGHTLHASQHEEGGDDAAHECADGCQSHHCRRCHGQLAPFLLAELAALHAATATRARPASRAPLSPTPGVRNGLERPPRS